jgi:hypothetical protein
VRDGLEPAGPLAALAAYLRLLRGDIGGTVAHGRRALATALAGDPLWALGPQMVLASGLWWSGEAVEAAAIVETVTRTARTAGISAITVCGLGVRAAIALDEQDEGAAETLAREAIELMHRATLDEHPWAAMAHIVPGTLLGRGAASWKRRPKRSSAASSAGGDKRHGRSSFAAHWRSPR